MLGGAPAIAIVGALSLAVECLDQLEDLGDWNTIDAVEYIKERLIFLKTSRPTAVNLSDAGAKLLEAVEVEARRVGEDGARHILTHYIALAEEMMQQDILDNRAIGRHGADWIMANTKEKIRILTHCNTGSLATAGWVRYLAFILIRQGYSIGHCSGVTRSRCIGSRLLHRNTAIQSRFSPNGL
jgi:methylthioribose-1-phosphate isomerase